MVIRGITIIITGGCVEKQTEKQQITEQQLRLMDDEEFLELLEYHECTWKPQKRCLICEEGKRRLDS